MNNNVLIAVGGVIVIIIGFLIYGAMNDDKVVVVPITATSTTVTSSTSAQIQAQKEREATLEAQRLEAEAKKVAFTIDVKKLPEAQQLSLKTMGVDDTSFDITNAMVTCAKVDMSDTRLNEVKGGASVTAAEGIKLMACYNAK